jgi:DNA-binding HxlR family transcriptional regulator
MDVIGGKWKVLILWALGERPCRFGALRRELPGVTEKVLAAHLRELEADGIVHREEYDEVPPRVEYSLTPRGAALNEALAPLGRWGRTYVLGDAYQGAAEVPEGAGTSGTAGAAAHEGEGAEGASPARPASAVPGAPAARTGPLAPEAAAAPRRASQAAAPAPRVPAASPVLAPAASRSSAAPAARPAPRVSAAARQVREDDDVPLVARGA